MTPLLNTLRTWAQIVALVILVTWAMGLTTWPVWQAILVAGLILLLGRLPEMVLSWLASRETGPRNGGDVVITPGNGRNGGHPGRIVLGHLSASDSPAFVIRNSSTGDALEIYVGEEDPAVVFGQRDARTLDRAVYIRTRDPAVYRRGVEGWERL